jgi:hypothetical protein
MVEDGFLERRYALLRTHLRVTGFRQERVPAASRAFITAAFSILVRVNCKRTTKTYVFEYV